MEFKNIIKDLRKEKELSQIELAARLGVSKSSVAMWENGERKPSHEKIEEIADFFNVDLDYLWGRSSTRRKITYDYLLHKRSNLEGQKKIKPIRIPVIGMVHAGRPADAIEDILDWEEVTPELASRGDLMALQVKGDCMNPRFTAGDIVIVLCQSDVDSGDVAIVMVNRDEAEMKKIKKFEDGSINLIPTNPSYPARSYTPKDIEDLPVRILGKVIELRAKF